jgi:membrane protein YqaA with SNARE-associated domain
MKQILHGIEAFALGFGGPGLLLIAFLDSSFLSFPQANDLLIVWMVLKQKPLMPYYAAMATLGSLLGCLALYFVARKGGEALLRRRFHERHVDRALVLFQRYGVLAVVVPALLPPPAPFKLFVLMAGVAEVPPLRFGLAVAGARAARYFGIGLLTVLYGDAAVMFLREHRLVVWGVLAALALAGALVYFWSRRRRSTSANPGAPEQPV